MKKHLIISALGSIIIIISVLTYGCKATQEVAAKGGSELWSENCGRCHNAPPSSTYSSEQWEVLGAHMRMRAHITAAETKKIVEFLTSAK